MSDGTRGEDKESLVTSPGATPYGRVTDGTNEVSERKVTRVPVPGSDRKGPWVIHSHLISPHVGPKGPAFGG